MTGLESKEGGPGDGTCQRMGTDPLGARPRNCDSEPGGGGRGCCQRAGSLYPEAHAAYPGGAGEGNRTPVWSLGSSRSAIEPRPLGTTGPSPASIGQCIEASGALLRGGLGLRALSDLLAFLLPCRTRLPTRTPVSGRLFSCG